MYKKDIVFSKNLLSLSPETNNKHNKYDRKRNYAPKYGFVAGDGSGKELTDFVYNSLEWDPLTCFFKATWGDEDEQSGYVTPHGLRMMTA